MGSKAAHESRCGSDESTLHMESQPLLLTHIGGPTAMIEVGGIRLLTDPTFDPAGGLECSRPEWLRTDEQQSRLYQRWRN